LTDRPVFFCRTGDAETKRQALEKGAEASIHRIAVWSNVLDLDSHDITAAKLAIDGQVKQGEVAYSPL
jgi:hypothetical protein